MIMPSLRDALLESKRPVFLFGTVPAMEGTPTEKIRAQAVKFAAKMRELATDGYIVYDIQEEKGRTPDPRPFPFRPMSDPVEYAGTAPNSRLASPPYASPIHRLRPLLLFTFFMLFPFPKSMSCLPVCLLSKVFQLCIFTLSDPNPTGCHFVLYYGSDNKKRKEKRENTSMSFTPWLSSLMSVWNSPNASVTSYFPDFVLPDGHP
jgi:hypothetical protein